MTFRQSGSLVGFCGYVLQECVFEGKSKLVIYGTIVFLDPGVRNKGVLQKLGIKTLLKLRILYPRSKLYFAGTFGTPKSYTSLARTFADYWPKVDKQTPAPELQLLDKIMQRIYGADWLPETSCVEWSGGHKYSDRDSNISNHDDPIIKDYLSLNPNYPNGSSLACIIPINFINLRSLISRSVKRANA